MSLWHNLKASMQWPRWNGQTAASGLGIDWQTWGQSYPGTNYDYAAVANPLYLNPVVMACVAWYQASIPSAEMQVVRREVQTGEDNKVPGHDLLKFLRRPNDFYSAKQLWQATLPDLLTNGNAYWLKIRNGSGKVLQLWNVPCNRIAPQWKPTGREFIGGYLLRVEEADPQPIPVRDVVHFRVGQDPQNERLGWSPIRAGLREVAILNSAANYQGALIRNGCVPTHLLSPKPGSPPWTGDQAKAFLALWANTCGGDKVGRAVASSLPMDATKIGFSMAELDLGSMSYAAADQVCALMLLNSMVVGIASGSEHKTYANYEEAARAAWRTGAIPLLNLMASTLDLQLLPDFGDAEAECIEWSFDAVDILQEDDNALAARLDNAVKVGRISRNEARAQQDLPPIEDPSYDLPQPLTANGYPWDQPPEWVPEPEPMPMLAPGQPPESSGDAQAQAPAPAASPAKAECDYCYVRQASPWVAAVKANLCDECCKRVAPEEFAARKALAMPQAVRITTADVAAAEVLWDGLMPEAEGILSAKPANGKR